MGIRPYKKLGWGLTGLEHNAMGHVTDPRINTDALLNRMSEESVGPLYLDYLRALRDAEPENSDAWFDVMMSVGMVEADLEQNGRVEWPLTHQSDAGRRDLLLIQPVGYRNWSRYGDIIDHAQEEVLYSGIEPRVDLMPHGIFPYEGLYMDSRTGRKLDSTAKRLFERLLEHVGDAPEKQEIRQRAALHLATTMGFETSEEARRYIAPVVPPDIMHVITWLNLFNGPDVHLGLRPMLYTYWT